MAHHPQTHEATSADHDGAQPRRAERALARFRHLYESRDGLLALFEDQYGHLTAVDTSKLV